MLFTMKVRALCTVLGFSSSTVAQIGATVPVASACDNSLPSVVCINKYGAVLPYHFFRKPDGPKNQLPLSSLDVPKNPSFDLVRNADFLVYDRDRGLDLLGPNPSHEFVFTVSEAVHEVMKTLIYNIQELLV